MTAEPFDLDKVPKAVLVHALSRFSMQPPRPWKQDVDDLRRLTRQNLRSDRGDSLQQEIIDQLAAHKAEQAEKNAKK